MANKLERMNRLSLLKVIKAQNEKIEELNKLFDQKSAELDAAKTAMASVDRIADMVDKIAKKLGIDLANNKESAEGESTTMAKQNETMEKEENERRN